MRDFINNQKEKIIKGKSITFPDALKLLEVKDDELTYLFSAADQIRSYFRGKKANLCAITNAKSGNCPEDCSFCVQSSHHNTKIEVYPLISPQKMLERAEKATKTKTHRFCLVTSGCSLKEEELKQLCLGIKLIKDKLPHLEIDASLGQLNQDQAKKLKNAGLTRYNHNIETSEDFFPKICTTHKFKHRLKTIGILKKIGLEVCCGGIFGLGETSLQRIELAFTLKELDVDCIPLNFLNPIAGTPLENNTPISAWELLKMVSIFRFILPVKEIKICGGRENNLKDLQHLIFRAGSDSIIIGDYLTTKGNKAEDDLRMIEAAGLEV